ncbi:hypothetical protein ACEPAF_413 [Sanghuangporus sanghuang]
MQYVDCRVRLPVPLVKSIVHGTVRTIHALYPAVRCVHVCHAIFDARNYFLADIDVHQFVERTALSNCVWNALRKRDLLDPSRGSTDELIITLPGCKHTFTVETLDGHCQLQDYYELDANGTWRGLKSSAPGFKLPPTCPTCRRAIRSPRYGRVYKRADLDILERNVASRLTKSIHAIVDDFKSVDARSLCDSVKVASTFLSLSGYVRSEDEIKSEEKSRSKILNSEKELPVPWNALEPGKHCHGLKPDVMKQWSKEVWVVKGIYERTLKVASARSAHMKAWDSAFSSLYRQEIESAVQEPTTAPRHPAEHAMRVARMKVGMSKPLADKRFVVEAFWLTIDIRILLVNVAQVWLTLTPRHLYPERFSFFKEAWSSFISFVLETCRRDARIALRIAQASQSRKQVLRSKVLTFSIELEILKLNFRLFRDAVSTALIQDELIKLVQAQLEKLELSVNEEDARHREYSGTGMADADFKQVFLDPMNIIRKDLAGVEESIRLGSLYTPLTDEEKQQIVAGLMANIDFAYSGHFYQCSNGHPFVIGDCGGAMQTTRCPECYELIGGSNHSLVSGNRANAELESIARANGARQNPWPWAR